MVTSAFWHSNNSFPRPGVSKIKNTHSLLYEGQFQDFQSILKYVLSQFTLLNLVSWLTPCWFQHCPLFEVFESSQCLCFHYLQIADCADGVLKPRCRLLHWGCSWIHLKPAVWRVPCMVCGSSIHATQFRTPQGLIVAHKSLSNLRKHYQS